MPHHRTAIQDLTTERTSTRPLGLASAAWAIAGFAAGALAASCYYGSGGARGPRAADERAAVRQVELRIAGSTSNYDVYVAAGSPPEPVDVLLVIDPTVIVSSGSPARPALTTGAFPPGSRVTIRNRGRIIGAGGAGGSGGNGGSGGPRACGRDGGPGGAAIVLTVDTHIDNRGEIFGGGGGGGGASGCNEAAGGGGGAGSRAGAGGAGATTLSKLDELAFCGQDNDYRTGAPGKPGDTAEPGLGGVAPSSRGGDGGGFGLPGARSTECVSSSGGQGGAGGFAIKRNGHRLTGVADAAYASASGAIRGAVR